MMRTRDLVIATALTSSLALPACAGNDNADSGSSSLAHHDTRTLADVELDGLVVDGALTEALDQMEVAHRRESRAPTLPPVAPAVPRPVDEPLPPPLSVLLWTWQVDSPLFGKCVHRTGNLLDVDRDGIPRDGSYVFDCHGIVSHDRLVTLTGTVSVRDGDDTSPRSGFDLVCSSFSVSATPKSATSRLGAWGRELDGSLETEARGDGSWVLTKDYDMTRESDARAATLTGQTVSTYAPTDTRDPFEAGELKIDAIDSLELPDGSTSTLRRVTRPTLHTTAACRNESELGFDAGSLSVEREDQPVLSVTFHGCGAYQATSGGEPVLTEE
jgi:hypothetical protein